MTLRKKTLSQEKEPRSWRSGFPGIGFIERLRHPLVLHLLPLGVKFLPLGGDFLDINGVNRRRREAAFYRLGEVLHPLWSKLSGDGLEGVGLSVASKRPLILALIR